MQCFDCRPIVLLSPEGKRLSKILENLTYVYIVIAILKLFFGDFSTFFNDMLVILMIVMTFFQASFLMASISIFFLLFQEFYVIVFTLLILQDLYFNLIEIQSTMFIFYLILTLASLVIYILLTYYIFLAYREFKALFIEQHSGNSGSAAGNAAGNARSEERQNLNRDNRNRPFSGTGYTWGT
jgi:hypothetical protein